MIAASPHIKAKEVPHFASRMAMPMPPADEPDIVLRRAIGFLSHLAHLTAAEVGWNCPFQPASSGCSVRYIPRSHVARSCHSLPLRSAFCPSAITFWRRSSIHGGHLRQESYLCHRVYLILQPPGVCNGITSSSQGQQSLTAFPLDQAGIISNQSAASPALSAFSKSVIQ